MPESAQSVSDIDWSLLITAHGPMLMKICMLEADATCLQRFSEVSSLFLDPCPCSNMLSLHVDNVHSFTQLLVNQLLRETQSAKSATLKTIRYEFDDTIEIVEMSVT